MQPSLCVLGAGSWGTALAIQAARNDTPTVLWGHTPEHIADLVAQRENTKYLPGYPFPLSLHATTSLEAAVKQSSIISSHLTQNQTLLVWTNSYCLGN